MSKKHPVISKKHPQKGMNHPINIEGNIVTFSHFNRTGLVSHCYSTRRGGVSSGVFESMNLGFARGDLDKNVEENYRRLTKEIGLRPEDLVLSNQVHKTQIKKVTKEDKGKGITRKSDIINIDGLITNEKGIGLTTFYADCVPLFFLDPIKKVIAISHAGWRGTIQEIGPKTIQMMITDYDSKVEDILVGVGPSIGSCCYEVSEDVKKQFAKRFNDDIMSKIVPSEYVDSMGENKCLLDLWKANILLIQEEGILPENIEVSGLCTKCHSDLFFSHRVMGNERGSQVGILALK